MLENIDKYRKNLRARRVIQNKVHSLEDFHDLLNDDSKNVSFEHMLMEFENIKDIFSIEERNRILSSISRKHSPDRRKIERFNRYRDKIQQIID